YEVRTRKEIDQPPPFLERVDRRHRDPTLKPAHCATSDTSSAPQPKPLEWYAVIQMQGSLLLRTHPLLEVLLPLLPISPPFNHGLKVMLTAAVVDSHFTHPALGVLKALEPSLNLTPILAVHWPCVK
ncbi:MAG: hypothetical protein Q9194_005831, partial [Teloschistes cf. exilis]